MHALIFQGNLAKISSYGHCQNLVLEWIPRETGKGDELFDL